MEPNHVRQELAWQSKVGGDKTKAKNFKDKVLKARGFRV